MFAVPAILSIPRWMLMWGLAFAIYASLKLLTWSTRTVRSTTLWRHAACLVGWPGMDTDRFLARGPCRELLPTAGEWLGAMAKIGLGIVIVFGILPRLTEAPAGMVGWAGMIGIVFVLHFGLFHLLSCVWRRLGCGAVPIMNWPIASRSLSEFWSRRWNLAFRDVTHRFLFRPLVRPFGTTGAMLIGFFISGLVHEAVISLPAGAGYGGPTCYFLIQGGGLAIERSRVARQIGLGGGFRGWLFCAIVVVLPCTLLFHRPFVHGVILPFLAALGVVS